MAINGAQFIATERLSEADNEKRKRLNSFGAHPHVEKTFANLAGKLKLKLKLKMVQVKITIHNLATVCFLFAKDTPTMA